MLRVVWILFSMYSPIVVANSSTDLLNEWQENVGTINHVQVEFEQSRHLSKRQRTTTSSGQAYFSKPNLLRWVLNKPAEEWIYDGKHLININSETKTGIRYTADSQQGQQFIEIMNLILDIRTLKQSYEVVSASEKSGDITLTLKPKPGRSHEIDYIEATLPKNAKVVRNIKIQLNNGNYTSFVFKNPSLKPIPSSKFEPDASVKVRDVR